jgi:integrase/recombinase XerC
VLVVMGKGARERSLSLSPLVVRELRRYGVRRSGYVFARRDGRGGPNTARNISYRISRHHRSVGVAATAHQWRHWFATELLDAGANVREVQEALGHERLESTAIYTRVRPRSIAAAMAALPVPAELAEAA